jgi:hypothetical protein
MESKWSIPVISALRRLRQENHKFEVSLSYVKRPYFKKKRKKEKKTKKKKKEEEEKRKRKEK